MPTAGVRVLTIGKAWPLPYEMRHLDGTADIFGTLATFRPDVIITSTFFPGPLNTASFEIRKRWIHVDPAAQPEHVSAQVELCYAGNLWGPHPNAVHNKLVTIYTGTFNTGDYLRETYQSLREQSYPNWEWVVVDDESSDATWERLCQIAREDYRVRVFRTGLRLGKIGAVKDVATNIAKGEYLVELDHDDMLTDFALDEIVKAFNDEPEVGFVYSNCANFFENGEWHRFTDDFWKDRYRDTEYKGKKWLECLNPDIYDRFGPHFAQQFGWFLTVGPNHVRAFRASTLRELGGYNPSLPVADDWDLYARFFLRSKCKHIAKMLYLYRFRDNWANATFTRNQDIQDNLALGRGHYAGEFEAFNAKRLAENPLPEPPPEVPKMEVKKDPEEPAFVIASRTPEEAIRMENQLPAGTPIYTVIGAKSILEAYEQGRQAWKKYRRVVYIHDDVVINDVDLFLKTIKDTKPGLHGVCGSAAPGALKKGPWWDMKPCAGKVIQGFKDRTETKPLIFTDSSKAEEVHWLDGLCLIAVDQTWAWKVSGNPEVWHGYDWLASKRTKKAKGKCFVLPQKKPLLTHLGQGRMEDYDRALASLREKSDVKMNCLDVSFVVLDAATMPETDACLASIQKYAPGAQIIVVANGSKPTEETKRLADVLVELEGNLGFAAGCNRGAMEANGRLVCFMNNDARFVDDTPARLMEAVTESHPIVAPYSNRAKPPQGDTVYTQVPALDCEPDMVVGLCMMMPLALFESVGGFDTRLNTWEDDDFCKRAARRGARCKIVGSTYVEHDRHSTFQKLGMDVQQVMRDNGKLFHKKHPSIRVIAIAKNEEKAIKGFIQQFEGIVGEVCIYDTGSTDATLQIAKANGARVHEGKLEDFAEARNAAIAHFSPPIPPDWIIMIDIDERLDAHTLEHLPELAASTPHDILLAPLKAVYANGTTKHFVSKPFMFRNKKDIVWVFKVHEKLIGSERQALVKNACLTHLLELHDDGRREQAEGFYKKLMDAEPYFTDKKYREEMRKKWPILDYDRLDDPRIRKIFAGPLITVVIPTYKRAELLKRAMTSAQRQDYPNLDIVIVGDHCPELPEKIEEARVWNRIRMFNLNKNHGSGGAVPRNYALMLAAGQYIAYLDDDNAWEKNHVSSLYEVMRNHNAAFVFSSMKVDGKDLKFREPKAQGIDTSCVLHRRELLGKYGWWKNRTEANYSHDWEFISRWVKGGEKWDCTSLPTLNYNADTSGQPEFIRAMAEQASKA